MGSQSHGSRAYDQSLVLLSCPKAQRKAAGKDDGCEFLRLNCATRIDSVRNIKDFRNENHPKENEVARVLAAELCHKNRQRTEYKRFSERKSSNVMK
ncbi:hypothetical protein AH70_02175 [Pediococcus damnosus LMG 28219]|nr:hypothetical protein AH70_02175 [Pediococcus damnosus LMG 28219]PIO81530.1 hypothetical protein BSQ38_07665 [Pediococcus damnosus]PIO84939.1 hypothetical protein BSQ37_02900 [Pediococcus damnosus]PJE48951.1 hypothetical protein BSQ36_02840 [Pediococcus damnosus]